MPLGTPEAGGLPQDEAAGDISGNDASVPVDWECFQFQMMSDFVQNSRSFWQIMLTGNAALFMDAVGFERVDMLVALVVINIGNRYLWQWWPHGPFNFRPHWRNLLAHNAVFGWVCFALLFWATCKMNIQLRRHKAFVSGFTIINASSWRCYLPAKWHIMCFSIPSCFVWISWHYVDGAFFSQSVIWGIIWPVAEYFHFRIVEDHEWTRHLLIAQEKRARCRSEALEKAIHSMHDCMFDASCECDASGVVLADSPKLRNLFGIDGNNIVGRSLKALATSADESERIANFLKQSTMQHDGQRQSTPQHDGQSYQGHASKIETSLQRDNAGCEMRVVLYCVAIPAVEGSYSSRRLLIGCQCVESLSDCATAYEAGEAEMGFSSSRYLQAPQLLREGRTSHIEDQVSESGLSMTSLAYTTTGTLAPSVPPCLSSPSTSPRPTSVATQTEPAPEAGCLAGRGYGPPRKGGACPEAASQTEPQIGITRPPRLKRPAEKAHSPSRKGVCMTSSQCTLREFEETPSSTVNQMLGETARFLNPRGRGCCAWHVALVRVRIQLSAMLTGPCNKQFAPLSDWQCRHCKAMNSRDADSDSESGDGHRSVGGKRTVECEVCCTRQAMTPPSGSCSSRQVC